MIIKRKTFFMIARIIMLFVMGLVVAFIIALSQVNLETLRGNILTILRDSTGLDVEIDGAVSWKFSLRPRIELNQVRVLNAPWAKEKYAFEAEHVDVRLNLLSLFQDRPTIQEVRIYDSVINLEKNSEGKLSAEFTDKSQDVTAVPTTEISLVNNEQKIISDIVKSTSDNASVTATMVHDVNEQPRFPFQDLGLGAVEVRNLTANIFGSKYIVPGFSVHYMPKEDKREYGGWIKFDTVVFPFIVSFSEYDISRKIYPVRIAFSTGGDALIADIALEGKSLEPIDFIIRGDISDITELGKLFDVNLAGMPTINVNVSGGIDRKKLTLRKSLISVRGTNINLMGSADFSKKVTVWDVEIESKSINLKELFPELYIGSNQQPDRELNVFKDIPLYGKDLLGRNLKLRLNIDNLVVYRDLNIRDIDVTLRLNNDKARIGGVVNVGGGDIRLGANIDIKKNGYMAMQAGVVGRNISVGKILSEIRINDLISDLPVDIEFYGRANGSNLSEVMQTITGPVQVYSIGSGYAHSALVANMYGTDFLTSLRHSIQDLFRTDKKYNQMKISCVAVNTKLRNGVAETQQGVAVETNAINLLLAGNVNLGKETIRLSLTTVPVRGLKLSLTGNVVNSIEITGNLAEPDIKISGAAVAGKVASATGLGLLLAPFTGGIGLVAGAGVGLLAGDLLENWLADDEPCKTAMKRGAPPRRHDPEWLNKPVTQLLEDFFDKN